MADYSDELADELYRKFPELDPNQRKVWKSRKKISDRYLKEGFAFRKRVNKIEKVEDNRQDRLAQVFGSEKFEKITLWKVAELPVGLQKNFCDGKTHLHEDERKRLTNLIQHLRVTIKNALPEEYQPGQPLGIGRCKQLLSVARSPFLRKIPSFGEVLGRKLTPSNKEKTYDEFSIGEYQQMIDALSILLLETAL